MSKVARALQSKEQFCNLHQSDNWYHGDSLSAERRVLLPRSESWLTAGLARTFFCVVLAALLYFGIATLTCSDAQETPRTRDHLFGILLSREAKSLLAEVENFFGKQVREEWLDEKDGMSGIADVDNDGTAVIRINPAHGRKIDVIIHELYHLKQRAEGFPALVWSFPKNMGGQATQAATKQLTEQLYDPILHYIFYPEVRVWGINPGETFEMRTRQALDDNTLTAMFTDMDRDAIALYYFKIRLEVKDPTLTQQLDDILQGKQKYLGIELGKRLSQIVKESNPRSPEASIKTLIDCLNVLYEGRFQFKPQPWTSRQLGTYSQKGALIEIVQIR